MKNAFFPDYPDCCGWNALLPPRAPRASAKGDISAKYAVVGAGFTGLAVARRLSELDPTADIVVLEAITVGEGSSGRNSGFLAPADIAGSIDANTVEKNVARNRYVAEGFEWLLEPITRNKIECDLHQTGRIKAAATLGGEGAVHDLLKIVRALKVPHTLLDAAQLQARIGTGYYRLGIFTEVGHLCQPAALIRGIADTMPPTVRLYEQSPMVSMRKAGKWRLETPDALVTADTVIMATNSSIKNFGYLRDRLVTIYTYAAITEAMSTADSAKLGSMPSWGVLPAHRLGTTLRRVGSNRFMVRSIYSYERGISADVAHAELLARFHRRYRDLAHVEFEHIWGGTTALTMNGAPFWGKVDDDLFASAGCNGSGIVKGTILGKRLAEHITGQDVASGVLAAYGTANWIAPEPFRTIGFNVVSAVERRRAGLES